MTEERRGDRNRRGRESDAPSRVPPHNLQAEESLLGACLLSKSALEVLAKRLTPADFYKPAHGHIAEALIDAFHNDSPADPITIGDALGRRGLLETIGGQAELVSLQSGTPATTSADRYATIVHDHATLRRLIGSAGEIAELGYSLPEDPHEALLRAQDLLGDVSANNGSRTFSTLEIADVAALLETDLEPEEPILLTRADGRALVYAGKMHVFQAEPSSGKTWLALLAALEVLNLGGAVGYIDYEDTAKGIIGRLLALGAEPSIVRDRFGYIQPVGPFGANERIELEALLDRLNPDLVVIDGVGEALARDGYQEDRAAEVLAWIEKVPRWISRTGAAVIMLDHVVKDREQQGRWARGSGAKLGAVDGASYQIKTARSFSRHRDGVLKLVIAKDKPGGVGSIGETAAVAHIEPKADGARVVVRLDVDTGELTTGDTWKPTGLMRKVSEELEGSRTPLTATALKSLIPSDKPKIVSQAIARLILEGFIVEQRSGRSTVLRLVKPYAGEGTDRPPPPEPDAELDFDPSIDPETGDPYEVVDDPPSNVTRGPWPDDPGPAF